MTGYSNKEHAVLSIFARWKDCTKCELGSLREKKKEESQGRAGNMVFGDGNVDADMVIIGIGPGEQEDELGFPFAGESGNILNDYLSKTGMLRDELFLLNVVACRPYSSSVDFKTKQKKEENRDPTPPERTACRPFWQEVLYTVDPLLVVVMGKPAVIEVTGKRSAAMGDVQGTITTCSIPGKAAPITYPVVPMYHPAFLARSGDYGKGGPWHQALISWKRAIHFLDQLRNLFRGIPMPDRGFKETSLIQ